MSADFASPLIADSRRRTSPHGKVAPFRRARRQPRQRRLWFERLEDRRLLAAEIAVFDRGLELPDGATVDFGSIPWTQWHGIEKQFKIENHGTDTLEVTIPSMPAGFEVLSGAGYHTVAGGKDMTFEVRLIGNSFGSPSGSISITTNDSDENPFDLTLMGTVTNSPDPSTVWIVDNGDSGFSATSNWASQTQGYQGDVHTIAASSGGGSQVASWEFRDLPNGYYRIWATWPAVSDPSTSVTYTVLDDQDSRGTHTVDQSTAPNAQNAELSLDDAYWREMGDADIVNGILRVSVSGEAAEGTAGKVVAADAIRIQRISDYTSLAMSLMYGNDPDFTRQGTWMSDNSGYGGQPRYLASGGSGGTATWTFNVSPGFYQVWTNWWPTSGNATNAPFSIYEFSTSEEQNLRGTVNVNQSLNPDDFPDGGITWESLGGPYQITSLSTHGLIVQLAAAGANGQVIADAVRIDRVIPVAAPEIQVSSGGSNIPDGGTLSFTTAPGVPVQKTLTIKNVGTEPLELTALSGLPITGFTITPDFTADSLEPNDSTSYTVSLQSDTTGNYQGTLSFDNNDGDENPFDVILTGAVAAQVPEIGVLDGVAEIADGGTVDFGTTSPGVASDKVLTVSNDGSANLTLNSLAGASFPAGFSLVNDFGNLTLTPGGSTQCTIRMQAADAGNLNGPLAFGNNDGDEDPFDLWLQGEVVAVTGSDVESYLIAKGQQFVQNKSEALAADLANPYFFFSQVVESWDAVGTVNSASVRTPGGSTQALTRAFEDGPLEFEAGFASEAKLNAAFGTGPYRFTIDAIDDGVQYPSLSLPAPASPYTYPNAPHVTNWDDAQVVDATSDFTVTWDEFTAGTDDDFIQLCLWDAGGQEVFCTPGPGEDDALTGTSTSTVIPAWTLDGNGAYQAELLFAKVVDVDDDADAYSGAIGVAVYVAQTGFPVVVPPPGGWLQFSTDASVVTEQGGEATITVTRTGGTAGPVSVDYETSNGTASDGTDGDDPDYEAAVGTVEFADGDATPQTFTVTILDDDFAEPNETVLLTLSNPSGDAALGPRSSAHLTILDNERLYGPSPYPYFDNDGDAYTVKLTGPGTVEFRLDDPDGDGHGSIDAMWLTGTNATTSLSITVTKTAGDGEVPIGQVFSDDGGDLKSLLAAKSDLTGAGLDIAGWVGQVTFSDVKNDAGISTEIRLGGNPAQSTKMTFGDVLDSLVSIETGATLSSLTARSISGTGLLQAPAIGTLSTTAGPLRIDLQVDGAVQSIKSNATADGGASGSWTAASFGTIAVSGGDFAVDLVATADATTLGKTLAVGKLTVTGGGASGSWTAASFGTLAIAGGEFAVDLVADRAVTSIAVKGGGASGSWTAGSFGTIAVVGGDFAVDLQATADAASLGKTLAVGKLTVTDGGASGWWRGLWQAASFGTIAVSGGDFAVDLQAERAVKSIAVKVGGANGAWQAASFGTIAVSGGDFAVDLQATATAATLGKTAAVGKLTVTGGDFTGHLHALGNVGTVQLSKDKAGLGGALRDTSVAAAAFGTFSIGGDLTNSVILAGANLGADLELGGTDANADSFGAGSIAKFTVGGQAQGSMVGAGLDPVGQVFRNGNDAIVGGTASKVGSFTITGAPDPQNAASADNYFRAGAWPKSVKIGGLSVNPQTDPRFLDLQNFAEVGVTDADGRVLLHLAGQAGLQDLPVRLRDGISGEPIPGLVVGVSTGTGTEGLAVLEVFDPTDQYPPRFILLHGEQVTEDAGEGEGAGPESAPLAESEDDEQELAVEAFDRLTLAATVAEEVKLTDKLPKLARPAKFVTTVAGTLEAAGYLAKLADKLTGGDVSRQLGQWNLTRPEPIAHDQALARITAKAQDDTLKNLAIAGVAGLFTGGVGAFMAFSAGMGVTEAVRTMDEDTILSCPEGQLFVTTLGNSEIYSCLPELQVFPLVAHSIVATSTNGEPVSGGYIEMISQQRLGEGVRVPVDGNGRADFEAPAGKYGLQYLQRGRPPLRQDVELPPGGANLEVHPQPPQRVASLKLTATPAITGLLDPDTQIRFTVEARDAAGNVLAPEDMDCVPAYEVHNPVGSTVATIAGPVDDLVTGPGTGVLTIEGDAGAVRVDARCGVVQSKALLVSGSGPAGDLPRILINAPDQEPKVAEGNPGQTTNCVFDISLDRANTQTVTVDYNTAYLGSATPGNDYRDVTNKLVFKPGDPPKRVLVPVLGDAIDENDEQFALGLSNPVNARLDLRNSARCTIQDDDLAGIAVAPTSGLITDEGGKTASFTVKLNSEPTAKVTINLDSNDKTEGTVSRTSLTFDKTNWKTAQTVTVTGRSDGVWDGDVQYSIITEPAVSADPNYNGINPADVEVTNKEKLPTGSELWVGTLTGTAVDPFSCLLGSDAWYQESATVTVLVPAPGLVAQVNDPFHGVKTFSGTFSNVETAVPASGLGCSYSVASTSTPETSVDVTTGYGLPAIVVTSTSILMPGVFTSPDSTEHLNARGFTLNMETQTATVLSGTWQATVTANETSFAGGDFTFTKFAGLMADEAWPAAQVSGGAVLTSDLTPTLTAAVGLWGQAGAVSRLAELARQMRLVTLDLPEPFLAATAPGVIYLDRDAAGHGWYLDPTPRINEQFVQSSATSFRAVERSPAAGRMDLLTVLTHELGHTLGLDDLDPELSFDNLMAGTLPPGVRRVPWPVAVDALFASGR